MLADGLRDADVASLLERHDIHVAVDLAGYVGGGRTAALAGHPAPIAVNYFGYPGTLGTPAIDYIMADAVVVPPGSEEHYAEKIVRLPDCYYPVDGTAPLDPPPARSSLGLPEGLVFCCFNNTYKITPELFDIWIRLLQRVEGSVLWLYAEHETARARLRAEAEARGVRAERVVFAARVDHAGHLARLQLADLVLDTLPCNAHTTAGDALLAGVPMVTCIGRSFAARVAGSMLHAADLPELVAADLGRYEAMTFELAASPERRLALRERLCRARGCGRLFDTARLCRHVEAAYTTMWELHAGGQPPGSFSVPPSGP